MFACGGSRSNRRYANQQVAPDEGLWGASFEECDATRRCE